MARITSLESLQPSSIMKKSGLTGRDDAKNPDLVDSFSKLMKTELHKVNALQQYSDRMTEDMAAGKVENVHDVMIAATKAKVAMELTLEMRNKLVEAYREMIRMQI